MPIGDVTGWRQVFADDFTKQVRPGHFRQALSGRWHAYTDGSADTSKHGVYMTSKVVSVHDGVLDFYLHSENHVPMGAALVPALPTMLYGRYIIRFKADPLPGYKLVCLLWPDSEVWPRDGEIDFPEGDLNGKIWLFAHHQDALSGGDQEAYSTTKKFPTWHTAVITWSPAKIVFVLDGVKVGSSTTQVPRTPMHWVLQAETTLNGTSPPDNAAGHVLVDWLTAYAPV